MEVWKNLLVLLLLRIQVIETIRTYSKDTVLRKMFSYPERFVENLTRTDPSTLTWSSYSTWFTNLDEVRKYTLCCPRGLTLQETGNCGNDAHDTLADIKCINNTREGRHSNWNDPCAISWMKSYVVKNFSLYENGSIYGRGIEEGRQLDLDQYCLFREPRSDYYLAKVCQPYVRKSYWETYCLIFLIIIMLVIFVSYTLIKELKNFHGLLFRYYVATNFAAYSFGLGVQLTTESRTYDNLFTISEFICRYCTGSSILWLNVISFDMWRSFRCRLPIDCQSEERRRKKLIWYAIYALGFPAIHVCVIQIVTMHYLLNSGNHTAVGWELKWWGSVILATITLACNIVLHSYTVLIIRHRKKEVSQLIHGVNRHRNNDEKCLNLYRKLCIITVVHFIAWTRLLVTLTPVMVQVFSTLEVLQAVLIFLIFVCKENVRRSFRKRFNAVLAKSQTLD